MHWKIPEALLGHFLINSDACLKRCFLSEAFLQQLVTGTATGTKRQVFAEPLTGSYSPLFCVHTVQSNSQPDFWKQEFYTASLIALTDQRNVTCSTAIFTGGTFCSWNSIGK